MREILFRAKTIKGGKWVEGYYVAVNKPHGSRHGMLPREPGAEKAAVPVPYIDPATLCQYTGMRDSKGSRIFENDILGAYFPETVEDGPVYLRVVWDGCGFRTWQYGNDGEADRELDDKLDDYTCIQATVVGNTFDGINNGKAVENHEEPI
jgi:uncharacterized phage protein (TIGR01671 family)